MQNIVIEKTEKRNVSEIQKNKSSKNKVCFKNNGIKRNVSFKKCSTYNQQNERYIILKTK